MTKHSKNRTDRSFQTQHERQEAGFSTTKAERLGTDDQLPFGYCVLSLKPCNDPVASPQGYIYEKEYILELLAKQKKEIKEKEAQEKLDIEKEILLEKQLKQLKEDEKILEFDRQERGLDLQTFTSGRNEFESFDKRKARNENSFWLTPDITKKAKYNHNKTIGNHHSVGNTTTSTTSTSTTSNNHLEGSIFNPKGSSEDSNKKGNFTRCPFTGKKLKMKDLIPVNFEIADQELVDAGGGKGMYCCAVTKKPITHQKVVLIKPSGQIILQECVKTVVKPSMSCPVTGKPLKEGDIITLVEGWTGFSSHNETEVKSLSYLATFKQACGQSGWNTSGIK